MSHNILKRLAFVGCLALAITAYAQDRGDDRYHSEARSESWWHGHLFDRIGADLDHVQSVSSGFRDQYRLDRVRKELDELQSKYVSRGYDQPELDDVISALGRVVSDNRLSQRDHDMLADDLSRLREFREHHEGYR